VGRWDFGNFQEKFFNKKNFFRLGMSIISVIEIILFLLVFVCYAIAPQLVSPNLDSLGFKAHDVSFVSKLKNGKNPN
jgi:hypothetical protein